MKLQESIKLMRMTLDPEDVSVQISEGPFVVPIVDVRGWSVESGREPAFFTTPFPAQSAVVGHFLEGGSCSVARLPNLIPSFPLIVPTPHPPTPHPKEGITFFQCSIAEP